MQVMQQNSSPLFLLQKEQKSKKNQNRLFDQNVQGDNDFGKKSISL
jgi:hypothetical protein